MQAEVTRTPLLANRQNQFPRLDQRPIGSDEPFYAFESMAIFFRGGRVAQHPTKLCSSNPRLCMHPSRHVIPAIQKRLDLDMPGVSCPAEFSISARTRKVRASGSLTGTT